MKLILASDLIYLLKYWYDLTGIPKDNMNIGYVITAAKGARDQSFFENVENKIVENKYNFDWKFDNQGESLNDIIKRGQKVIDSLEEQHPKDTVAIVSHGIFIMVMTALILLGKDWDKKTFRKLSWALKISNGGISSFKYDPQTKYWTMTCFNDHGHLENES